MKEKLNVNQIPELKQAIIDLTEKEKNQLLIRLVNKDQILVEHLHFKLLEDEYDLIKRFETLETEIKIELKNNYSFILNEKYDNSAKLLLRLIRNLSGKINHFSKITKDINYELELRAILLIESYKLYKSILHQEFIFADKLRAYQITRIKAIVKLFNKLHDDLKFDFIEKYGVALELIFEKDLAIELKQAKLSFRDFKID